ncbi:hypothetical protein PAT3040_02338 [Paenibacillus agaridevorans]|jgi:hypothetical protein|uniref:Uncharacterized protein n=1 Tax=Paenibacillus agaridevorans TaxID=171404 RepID=A0A2R5EMI8_9BACL|nr:hypothetical protein PAT3040_02338 [Paenibacillus agaridevorans]
MHAKKEYKPAAQGAEVVPFQVTLPLNYGESVGKSLARIHHTAIVKAFAIRLFP